MAGTPHLHLNAGRSTRQVQDARKARKAAVKNIRPIVLTPPTNGDNKE